MFYIILTIVFAGCWYFAGRKERAQNKEKMRQAALWKLAGIKEIIYRSEFCK